MTIAGRYPLWTRGDLDGFFGLMVDNLVQVLMIIALCTTVAGLPVSMVYERILPGVAVSLLVGNLFYAWQARGVARRDGNWGCTALPYGISTPTVFAFVFFIMGPVYRAAIADGALPAAAAEQAWIAGVLSCLVSGTIEFLGAFVAERVRRITPRAALLGVLAAVGITFIASDFAFRIFTQPLVGLAPLGLLLLAYFGRFHFPWGLPGGLLSILAGGLMAWLLAVPMLAEWTGLRPLVSAEAVGAALTHLGWCPPQFFGGELLTGLQRPELVLRFLTVSIPLGLLNVLGSLQNIESAEAAGDRFRTTPSLAVNGLGTIVAGLFGSCFPMTIYIGHPAWKALGARAGYSIANGLFFTVVFFAGGGVLLKELIPIEAGAAIVMFIGIVITAQAFQATPRAHAPAVALALFPAMAALLIVNMPLLMGDAGAQRSLAEMLISGVQLVPTLPGMVSLTGANSSWLVTTLILTAFAVALIERRFSAAAGWMAAAAVLTALGLLHAYRVEGNEIRELFLWQPLPASSGVASSRGLAVAAGYAIVALLVALAARRSRGSGAGTTVGETGPIADL